MLVCPGCGGRNPPDLDLCPFCHRRGGGQKNGSRALRPLRSPTMLVAAVVLVVALSVVVLFLARSMSFP